MSDFSNYSRSSSDNKISVTDVMRFSYTYFVDNFSLFVKLSIVPMLLWILLNVSAEVLLNEYGIAFNHSFRVLLFRHHLHLYGTVSFY